MSRNARLSHLIEVKHLYHKAKEIIDYKAKFDMVQPPYHRSEDASRRV